MMTTWLKLALIAAAASLCACGGGGSGDSDDDGQPATQPPPTRGTLIEPPPARLISISAADLNALLTATAEGRLLLQFVEGPRCGVDVHQLRYNSVDVQGAAITASGALMIPTGADAACQGPRPIVSYAHGTQVERAFNIANLTDSDNIEGLLIAVVFAARGYIVIAPNYAGFDTSSVSQHPFLHADQQANDMVDALAAGRSALPTSSAPTVTDGGRLFVTGYSQGGFVAMATHRLLQQGGATVTASAPMSGPYALAAFGDAVFYGQVVRSAPLFVTYLATGYERAYGDVYGAPTDMFESRYAAGVDTLLPTSGSRSDLFAQGKLPSDQLFSSTPPDPSYAPYTPATSPADLAPVFALGFGPENLVTNAFRLAYLQDAQAQPDGGFPTVTNGVPASAPANGLRRAFKANDLRTWTPTAPVLLCAGNEDPTVLYLNTDLMQRYWTANSAPDVRVLDLDGGIALNDPYAARKAAFAAAKEAVAAEAASRGADPVLAVAEAYHSALVPPFCLSAVQSFFDER
jgi:alpha-beta hydrolase superfamily lysophospholipase